MKLKQLIIKMVKLLIPIALLALAFAFKGQIYSFYGYFGKLLQNPQNAPFFSFILLALIIMNGLQFYLLFSLPFELNAARGAMKVKGQELERQLERLNNEFRDKAVKFTSLMVKVKDIASAIDKETLFTTIISVLEKGIEAEAVDIFLVDAKKQEAFLVRSNHYPQGADVKFKLSDESLLAKATREGLFVIRDEARKNALLAGLLNKGEIPAVVCVPLFKGKEIAGVINVGKLSGNREDVKEEEKLLITTVGRVAALAMANSNIYELTKDELVSQKKISQDQIEEKKKIKDVLSRYTSPAVMEQVLNHPEMLKLGGEKRMATVFFSDIRSFTTYSEKYPPERVVAILNEYLTAMTDIIMDYNGTLDKFVGDEIMAIWGVPVPQKEHAHLAVKASWAMLLKLKELQKSWQKRGVEPFDIGIGINTGEMIAGNMGSEKRMDYTVIGDHVNSASRIQTLTRQFNCHMLISEYTYQLVKEIVDAKALGYSQVKGKTQKILVYMINGVKL
ncbi:MAG: adenylate/guanylate cyclase domain-containing protein [Candidatus Wallbacteria bacterium]|nr:adenylate/guanylate cyclase domain-containing protein [Candidatus Wallbacteria bacterium]